jgi:outer membrane protein assembly factor BamB
MRKWLVALAVAGVLAATGLAAYRVFAPAEVSALASGPYPAAPAAQPGVIGSIAAAPLIVDGRLRVYAATRQVRADGPVDARTQRTPYWSYRRWPAQVVGVVAVGTTVVSRWSDGDLVALDGRTGRISWRSSGRLPKATGYDGGTTGASTVYAPVGMTTAGGRVIVRDAGQVRAFDAMTGRVLWRTNATECDGFTTVGGWYVVPCGIPRFYELATGQPVNWAPPGTGAGFAIEPVSCDVALSECAGIRTNSGGVVRGWLVEEPVPVAASGLNASNSTVVGDVVVAVGNGEVVARSARDNTEIWRWRGNTNIVEQLPVETGAVHLLTGDRQLVTLDPATGRERSRFVLAYGRERTHWVPGHVAVRDGFVTVERMAPSGGPEDYFSVVPIIIART